MESLEKKEAQIKIVTSSANGHSHTLSVTKIRRYYLIVRCDTEKKCTDGHPAKLNSENDSETVKSAKVEKEKMDEEAKKKNAAAKAKKKSDARKERAKKNRERIANAKKVKASKKVKRPQNLKAKKKNP